MKPEILSPAGSFEALIGAVRGGCDAVYVGSHSFSARAGAKNFDKDELAKAVSYCHLHGVLLYQAINTLVTDSELSILEGELCYACKIGVDGLIIQDLAVASAVKALCPEMPIHASTQMTIHTEGGILQASQLGFSRVVLARELSLTQIKRLCAYAQKIGIETEVFVHGALCMSVSGQCYMSAMFGSRSANRGNCAQACRLPFSTCENSDGHALSLKDLSLIEYSAKLQEIGASSLKIEGRMKRPEYCYITAKALSRALVGKDFSADELSQVFSRSGFTDGYFTDKINSDMFGYRRYEDVTASTDLLPQLKEEYKRERKSAKISFFLTAFEGKEAVLRCDDGENTCEVLGDIVQTAQNRPIGYDSIYKQLSRLGDTIYTLNEVKCDLSENCFLSASQLNDLRRKGCSELDRLRIEKNTRQIPFEGRIQTSFPKTLNLPIKMLRLSFENASSVEELFKLSEEAIQNAEFLILPISEHPRASSLPISKDKFLFSLPRYIRDEGRLISELEQLYQNGFNHVQITNIGQIPLCSNFSLHGGSGLNVTNSLAHSTLSELDFSDLTASFELTAGEINRLGSFAKTGVIGYGQLPLMLCVSCPVKSEKSCNQCKKSSCLYDRKGVVSPILCHSELGYSEVLNAYTLNISDKQDAFDVSFFTLCFCKESARQMLSVIEGFKENKPLALKNFTRGLYFRGIHLRKG